MARRTTGKSPPSTPANESRENKVWYYGKETRKVKKDCYAHHKKLLYEVLFRSFTRHNIKEAYWLLNLLPRCSTIDEYVLFRYIMVMINTVDTKAINKNFIIYLESLLSKLDLSKPDVFIELLSYLMSNNRIEDAEELYVERQKFMTYLKHRKVPLLSINIRCYGLLLSYLDWRKQITSEKQDDEFGLSTQGWLVNGMEPLRTVNHNYELFVMCIANVLLHYGFYRKAYLVMSEFQRNNPDNLPAQLLLHNFISKFVTNTGPKRRRVDPNYAELLSSEEEETRRQNRIKDLDMINNFSPDESQAPVQADRYPIHSDKKSILDNLIQLDPTNERIHELSSTYYSKIESIRMLMDSLEHVSVIKDPFRWLCLQDNLNEVISGNDAGLVEEVAGLWQTRYQHFWRLEDFLHLAKNRRRSEVKHKRVIKSVIQLLKSKFDRIEVMTTVEASEASS